MEPDGELNDDGRVVIKGEYFREVGTGCNEMMRTGHTMTRPRTPTICPTSPYR